MAITFIDFAVPAGNPQTSLTITIPTVAVGDILIVDAVHNGGGTLTCTDNDTGGNTWTLKEERDNGTSMSQQLFWKRATSATSAKTITVGSATNSCAATLTVYRGCESTGDPIEAVLSEANASGNETQAEITTLTNGAWVCLAVSNSPDNTISSQTCTSPGALTERAEKLSTGGLDCGIAHASAEKATAGATGAFTWAQTNSIGCSIAYALKPEGDANATPSGVEAASALGTAVGSGNGTASPSGLEATSALGTATADGTTGGGTNVTDDFNRADGGLGSNWTTPTGANAFAIDTNRAIGNIGGFEWVGANYTGATFSNDQSAQVKFDFNGSTSSNGIMDVHVRASNSARTYYFLQVNCAGNWYVGRQVTGTETILFDFNDFPAVVFADDDVGKLEVSGSGASIVVKAYRNGVQIGTDYSDTSGGIDSGNPGIALFNLGTGGGSGTPVIDDFAAADLGGSPDGNAEPSGVSATSALGTSTASGNGTASPSGLEVTSALGTVTATASANAAPTGQSTTSALGTAVGSGTGNVSPSGLEATSALGTAVASVNVIASPSGLEVTSALGTSTTTGTGQASPSGIEATSALGTSVASGNGTAAPSGLELTSALGTATASSAENGNATPSGIEATTALGTSTASGNGVGSPSGLEATSSLGTVVASVSVIASPSGLEAASALGTSIATGDAQSAITGLEATTALGTVTTSGTAIAAPSGLELTSALGTATATGAAAGEATPAGVAATAAIGTPTASGDGNTTPAGLEAASALGTATASSATNGEATPAGVAATSELGTVSTSGTANIVVTGVSATSALGTAEARADAIVAAFGLDLDIELGLPVGTANAEISVTGLDATSALGTILAQGDANAVVTGLSMLAEIGLLQTAFQDLEYTLSTRLLLSVVAEIVEAELAITSVNSGNRTILEEVLNNLRLEINNVNSG
jgi:hypothetical protein